MSLQIHAWEPRLLSLAYEALPTVMPAEPKTMFDQALLKQAYRHCKDVTARHSRSFYLASSLLPPPKQRAVWALYAFCRVTDDIVDKATGNAEEALVSWRRRILASPKPNTVQISPPDPPEGGEMNQIPPAGGLGGPHTGAFQSYLNGIAPKPAENNLITIAWADTQLRYAIPQRYVEQLIDGVEQDLRQTRYATFSDLATYAYGVASTVGLMSMRIIGFSRLEAIPYAVKLGVALQITNILRDVAEDWRAGRVYLPTAELESFGLAEADLAAGRVDDRWRAFMRFQIARNRQLYAEAWPGIALLEPDGRFAIAAAARLYEAILADIEAHDYDVFNRRAHVSAWRKLKMLPSIWWQNRQDSSEE